MKITWENIEGMYISRRGNLRKGLHTYHEGECFTCGKVILVQSCYWHSRKRHFCDGKCAQKVRVNFKHTPESIAKISRSKKGTAPWNKGLTAETNETVRRIGKKIAGDSHYNWKKGSWDSTRYRGFTKRKKMNILARDNYECQYEDCWPEAYGKGLLVVHHIDGDRTNPSDDNLQTLCQSCNTRLG